MEKICRSCMSESPQMRSVFETKQACEGNFVQLAEMLMACTSIQIASDDGLPIQLCDICEAKLDAAFGFKKQCEKSDSTLRQMSNTGNSESSEPLNIVVQPDLAPLEAINGEDFDASTYTCIYCQKTLRTKKGLVCHERRHTGEKMRYCNLCPAKFTRTNHLKRHLLVHSKSNCNKQKSPVKQKIFKCEDDNKSDQCGNENGDSDIEMTECDDNKDEDYVVYRKKKMKKEVDADDENKNKENETEKPVMVCEFCDRKFKYRKSFLHHMKTEHGMSDESDLLPNTCVTKSEVTKNDSEEFLSESNAACITKDLSENAESSDEENHLSETEKKLPTLPPKRKLYTCHVCNVNYTRSNHLTRHMIVHRAILIHKCNKCDKAYATPEHLDKHDQDDHINKPYVCNVCDKHFSRGEHFIRHLKTHNTSSTEEIHKCSICDKTFTRNDHLARHTKLHLQQDKRHMCGDCGKAFNRLDNLKTHQRIHSGFKDTSRLHLCIYCGKDFNSSSNMIVHMRRHTGERPYKCSICNKGFPRSHDLKCHERTHSGEKPYLCTLCGKSFNKSNKLLRHTRVHTGERPYVCNICGRAFTQSNDLALHMRRHTGARPYVCGVCPARFIQSGQLKAHRRSTNHWMDIPPDLKGGHRVEQVTPIINPAPIKFKTHGKSELKFKDEELDSDIIKEEPHNIIQHVNVMGVENDLTIIPQPYILDNGKLVSSNSNAGFLVFTSVLNTSEQAGLDPEIQACSVSAVHSDNTRVSVDIEKSSVTYSPEGSVRSYSVASQEQYKYENYH